MSNKCPVCGSVAYVGLIKVECSNPKCKHYCDTEEVTEKIPLKGGTLTSAAMKALRLNVKFIVGNYS